MPIQRYSFGTQKPDRDSDAGDFVRYEDYLTAFDATDYDTIEQAIKSAPQTFLPALLATAVEACIDKKVFSDDKSIERFVVAAILRKVNPKGER